jgi:hypothetical protein
MPQFYRTLPRRVNSDRLLGRLATRDPGGNQHFRNVFFKVQGKPDLRLMGVFVVVVINLKADSKGVMGDGAPLLAYAFYDMRASICSTPGLGSLRMVGEASA